MSSVFKKLAAAAISATIAVQSAIVPSAFAESGNKSVGSSSTPTQIAGASKELRTRLKLQGEKLAKAGKTSKYANAKIRWDDASEKPTQIRGIRSKASKNVAADVQAVFDDLAPIYGTSEKNPKKAELAVEAEDVSPVTSERHVRIKQTYAGLPVIGDGIVAHVDRTGNLYQIDGDYAPKIEVGTVPKISAKQALGASKRDEKKSKFKTTVPELAILSEPS